MIVTIEKADFANTFQKNNLNTHISEIFLIMKFLGLYKDIIFNVINLCLKLL